VYDSFYYLHIPKTGGRWFTVFVEPILYQEFKKNNIKISSSLSNGYGHYGWSPEITETTFVFSSTRNPVLQTLSYITNLFQKDYPTLNSTYIHNPNNNTSLDLLIHLILNPIFYSRIINNQSKNISQYFPTGVPVSDLPVDVSVFIHNLNRVNAFMCCDTYLDNYIVAQNILERFGLTTDKDYSHITENNRIYMSNPNTNKLYSLLNIEHKQIFKGFLTLDNYLHSKAQEKLII